MMPIKDMLNPESPKLEAAVLKSVEDQKQTEAKSELKPESPKHDVEGKKHEEPKEATMKSVDDKSKKAAYEARKWQLEEDEIIRIKAMIASGEALRRALLERWATLEHWDPSQWTPRQQELLEQLRNLDKEKGSRSAGKE